MARVAGEIVIERPVDEVFDVVADERNEPGYNPRMLRAEKLTDGPIGPGTRFAATVGPARRPMEMSVEYTAVDRPRLLASTSTMASAEFRGTVTFEPAGTGTRLRWAWDVRPKGLARLVAPLLTAVGRRQERQTWMSLKAHLERGGGT